MFRKQFFGALVAVFHCDYCLFLVGLVKRRGQSVAAAYVKQTFFRQKMPLKPAFNNAYNIHIRSPFI